MKTKLFSMIVATAIIGLFARPPIASAVVPTGTAFTYQGRLTQGGNNVNVSTDMRFILYDALVGGSQVGPLQELLAVPVSDGLFTVDLDFGAAAFGTEARWLDISVRSPAGSGLFTPLVPRQQVRPTPLAQFALTVDGPNITNLNASNIATGTVPNAAIAGAYGNAVNFNNAANSFTGSGAGLTALNAVNISAGTLPIVRGGTGATTASGAVSNLNAQTRVTGTAPAGSFITAINANGSVVTGTDQNSGGDITTVTAGAGLAGGGASGAVSLNIAPNGVTNSMLASDALSLNKVSGGAIVSSNSNIGIGTSSPSSMLEVVKTPPTNNINPVAVFRADGATNSAGAIRVQNTAGNNFNFGITSAGDFALNYNSNISLSSDLLRITSTGNVGIGTTTPNAALTVDGPPGDLVSLLGDGVERFRVSSSGTTDVGPWETTAGLNISGGDDSVGPYASLGWKKDNFGVQSIKFHDNQINIPLVNFGVDVVGDVNFRLQVGTNSAAKPTSNVWTIASDARLKKNVNTIEHALDDLLSLRGVTYQWIDPSTQGGMAGVYTGMIAQEVEPIFPEWISQDKRGYKHLTVIGFEGIVVEALRELRQEKNDEVMALRAEKDAEIAELRGEVAELRRMIEQLSLTRR